MNYEPDLTIVNQNNQIIAVIEVKDRPHIGRYEAAEMRRRLLRYTSVGNPKYFLLIDRDTCAFWHSGISIQDDLADFEFSIKDILQKFYINQHPLVKKSLDLVVFQLLDELTHGQEFSGTVSESFKEFLMSIRGAQVRFGAR